MQLAARLRALPSQPSVDADRLIAQRRAQGVDVVSLGRVDPDLPPPPHVVDALVEAARGATAHQTPASRGLHALRASMARWFTNRFKVSLSPNSEVLPIGGANEGLSLMPWIVTNPGDVVLVPDPGFHLYATLSQLAGATVVHVPLLSENDFLPDLKAIPSDVASRARLLFLNYPNNPTGALAPAQFYHDVVAFAKQYNLVVVQDMAFSEMTMDAERPLSFLEIPGAIDVGVELHSLSITYHMSGYRVGMAVGNEHIVQALASVKAASGSSLSEPVQRAAVAALDATPPEWIQRRNQAYARRRDRTVKTLEELSLRVWRPRATPSVWASVPSGRSSAEFASELLNAAGVWLLPGSTFGTKGEGYVRVSLTVPDDRLDEALKRIASSGLGAAAPRESDEAVQGTTRDLESEETHGSLGA